jgi:glycosyltransferase involved in cell wall biosynthesis
VAEHTSNRRSENLIGILHVVGTYFPAFQYGGPIHSIHNLCRELSKVDGICLEVLTTDLNGSERLNVQKGVFTEVDGVKVCYCKTTVGGRYAFSVDHWIKLRNIIRNYDLVHFHSLLNLISLYGPSSCRRANIPYILTPRGSMVPELIEQRSKWKKKIWIAAFDHRSLEGAAAVHVTTEREGEDVRKTGINPRKMAVIPNGVGSEIFQWNLSGEEIDSYRANIGLGPGEPLILFLGRVDWIKGLDILVGALGRIFREGIPFRLIVAGPDSQGYRRKLEGQIEREGLIPAVTFLGSVQGKEKMLCLAACDLLVLPSINESFGIAAAEGMASGKPVVVTEGVGIASDVKLAKAGLVVPFDADILAKAIRSLLRNPGMRKEMGRNGLVYAKQNYHWPVIARRMADLYRSVLSEHRKTVGRVEA